MHYQSNYLIIQIQVMKNNSRPPKGMYINHDDLVTMATGPNTQGEHLLKSMDREIVSYKRVVSLSFRSYNNGPA